MGCLWRKGSVNGKSRPATKPLPKPRDGTRNHPNPVVGGQ